MQSFTDPKGLTLDNEPGFKTLKFKSLMQRLGITTYYCTAQHSTTNGQIERVHSTIIKISRCLKQEYSLICDVEVIYRAAQQYNKSIHSVTNKKTLDALFNRVQHNDLVKKLAESQRKMIERVNKKRHTKEYQPSDIIYVKKAGERNKLNPRHKKETVKEDLGKTVKIYNRNRIVHKDNIRT